MYRDTVSIEKNIAFQKSLERAVNDIDKDKIGCIGIVGSTTSHLNESHDIDVLVMPKEGVLKLVKQ